MHARVSLSAIRGGRGGGYIYIYIWSKLTGKPHRDYRKGSEIIVHDPHDRLGRRRAILYYNSLDPASNHTVIGTIIYITILYSFAYIILLHSDRDITPSW